MHQIPLFILPIFLHVVLNEEDTKTDLKKPDFAPYCVTRDICGPDCECATAENCSLITMSKHTKEKVLSLLNEKRNMQSSGETTPSGMSMLIYDQKLEQLSSCWAAKCENIYSDCFRTDTLEETSQSVGQISLEEGVQPSPNHWSRIIDFWFGEFTSASQDIIEALPQGDLGERLHNFAQMVSDRVLYVGCAWSLLENTVTFVCTFGPRGPNEGEAIYEIGEICTRCFEGYECDSGKPFEKLCKKYEMYEKLEDLEETTIEVEVMATTIARRRTATEGANITKRTVRLSKAVEIDPDVKDYGILWMLALGLIFLVLITAIVFGMFYILRMGQTKCC